jgi:hypothetical protein
MVMINGFNSLLCFPPFPPGSISESFRLPSIQDLRLPLAASAHIQNIDFHFNVLNIAV